MIKFIVGLVLGFALATVGLTGVARIVDKGVSQVQAVARDQVDSGTADKQVDRAKAAVEEAAK
jgi:uncharacterized iron-regulated membrane protein